MFELTLLDDELDEGLTLPVQVGDATYRFTVMPCAGKDFDRLVDIRTILLEALTNKASSKQTEAKLGKGVGAQEIYRQTLGAVYDEMLAAGCSFKQIARAGWTALIWHTSGGNTDAAEAAWSGKAPSPSTRSAKGGAAASRTRSASTRSTTTRRKSSSSSRPQPSTGSTSSPTAT